MGFSSRVTAERRARTWGTSTLGMLSPARPRRPRAPTGRVRTAAVVPGAGGSGAREAPASHLQPQSKSRGCSPAAQTKQGGLDPPRGFGPTALGLGGGVSPPGRGRAWRVRIVFFFSAFINHCSLWPLPHALHNSGWVINRILGSFRLIKAEGGGAAGRRHDYITLSLPCQNKEYRRCRPLFLQHISARLLTPHFRLKQGLKQPRSNSSSRFPTGQGCWLPSPAAGGPVAAGLR